MVARVNSHKSNLINRMNKHSPGFLDCSQVVPVITMHTKDILLAVALSVPGCGMACRTPEDA